MSQFTSVKQYKGQPKKNWSNKEWLQHAWIQYHNPWLNEKDKEYWKDTIKRLTNN